MMLDNPVFNALSTGDARLASGTADVKWFDVEVSPFAGFTLPGAEGFASLHAMMPQGRNILFAKPEAIDIPEGWQILAQIEGSQFVFDVQTNIAAPAIDPVPLTDADVPAMVELATLTRPGPFNNRTNQFGHYYGIFEGGRLVAMTGQRLHPGAYAEISAVCTHPDALGKGYATALLQHQLQLIITQGKTPFLHVRSDNERAIEIYQRLGFHYTRPMWFYFLKRT